MCVRMWRPKNRASTTAVFRPTFYAIATYALQEHTSRNKYAVFGRDSCNTFKCIVLYYVDHGFWDILYLLADGACDSVGIRVQCRMSGVAEKNDRI